MLLSPLVVLAVWLVAPQDFEPRFEVASIKLNKGESQPNSNFPLGPGDVYVRNGGRLSATGFPLTTYLAFAYRLIGNQAQTLEKQLPEWAKADRYNIEARMASDPGKDGMRLAMRHLLAERFHLALHYEDREMPVFAFVLIKPGKLGKALLLHPDDSDCPTEQEPNAPGVVDGKPAFCNGIFGLPPSAPRRVRFGGRNVTLGFIADTFSAGVGLGRPMIDATGIASKVDFTLEWVQPPRAPIPPEMQAEIDAAGPSFEEALRDQLGIRLDARKGAIKMMIIDELQRPTEN